MTHQTSSLASAPVDSYKLNGRVHGPASPPWPAWIEVDLDAVEANVRALRTVVQDRAGILAVVKSQAYGLGAGAVAEAVVRAGAAGVAVARVLEGVYLRRRGVDTTILLMGPVAPGEEDEVVRWELTATLADLDTAERLAAAADRAGKIVPVHVKADTGLSRFGAQPYELGPLVARVSSLAPLLPESLYTHFASADDDPDFTRAQLQRFLALREQLREQGYEFRLAHACSSAAMLRYPEAHFDLVRPGLAILGAYPSPATPRLAGLRPAFQFKARLARVYDLPAGATVGYGRAYRATRPSRLALVPAGHSDGVPRIHAGRAEVLVRGRRAPLIGTVSMDQCVVDVTHVPAAAPGDEVALLGSQGDDCIDVEQFAAWSETTPHEVLTRVGDRVPRVYFRSGQPCAAMHFSSDADLELPTPVALG